MPVSSMVRRVINLPNSSSLKAQAVVSDIQSALAPYKPHMSLSADESVWQFEALLTSTQDTTLQASMGAWAARLGLAQLDTHVVTVNAGHA